MRFAVACLLAALALGRGSAMAQVAGDPRGAATQDSWVVSETTSPIDYSPVVVATATAMGVVDGMGMKLSIACRGGTTSIVVGGPGALPTGDAYTVSYAIDGGPPKALAAGLAPSGAGMALAGDIVGFLVSLPAQGEVAFRVAGRQAVALEGRYSLASLKITRERMAVSCKWPPRR